MKSVAVFCGSKSGGKVYEEAAVKLGKLLVEKDITLVYGGGQVGLMGIISDTVINEGGKVIGVIPQFLKEKEVAHESVAELHVVETMHQRKKMMEDFAEGFIMMPGGAGTLEEFFEIFTWAQLGLHKKPIGVYNVNGYYDTIFELLKHMNHEGFLDERFLKLAVNTDDAHYLIDALQNYQTIAEKQFNLLSADVDYPSQDT